MKKNPIVHIEIAGKNGPKLESFYSELLSWKISRQDVGGYDYGEIETGADFTAGIRHEPEGHAEIVLYLEVEDVDAMLEKALSLGAKKRIPVTDAGGFRFCLVQDPEGNPIGLTQKK